MAITLDIDRARWNKAIDDYQKASHKTASEAVLHQTRNLLFFTSRRLKIRMGWADAGAWGETIPRKGYDLSAGDRSACMLVAWLIRKKIENGSIALPNRGKKVDGKTVFRTKTTTRKGVTKSKYEFYKRGAKFYTREFARQWARKHTRVRKSHIGFSALLPWIAAREVIERAKAMGVRTASLGGIAKPKPGQVEAGGAMVRIKRIGDAATKVSVHSFAEFKAPRTAAEQPTAQSAARYQSIIDSVLPLAANDTILDIEKYIERKLKKRFENR